MLEPAQDYRVTETPAPSAAPAPQAITYSVVVPMLNEEGNVEALLDRLTPVMEATGEPFEIVVVDDGSTDATPRLLADRASADARLRVITFARNFGQEAAVQAGFLHSRGSWVVQMDGDLQNPPEELPKLMERTAEGYEIVYGVRTNRKDPWARKVASRAMMWVMTRLLGIPLPPDVTTFRVVKGDVARFIAALPEKKKFFSALAEWSGARSVAVPVAHAARAAGNTKYNLSKLINHTYDLMVSFSARPLKIVGLVGALFALSGLGFALYKVIAKLAGAEVTMIGWTSLFAAVVILGGFQLIAVSVIGEYIARIFAQVQDRPLYRIARRQNEPPSETADAELPVLSPVNPRSLP